MISPKGEIIWVSGTHLPPFGDGLDLMENLFLGLVKEIEVA